MKGVMEWRLTDWIDFFKLICWLIKKVYSFTEPLWEMIYHFQLMDLNPLRLIRPRSWFFEVALLKWVFRNNTSHLLIRDVFLISGSKMRSRIWNEVQSKLCLDFSLSNFYTTNEPHLQPKYHSLKASISLKA